MNIARLKQKLLKTAWPARFYFGRLFRIPLLGEVLRRLLLKELLLKILPLRRALQKRDKVVLPGVVVDHFIENSSYLFAMNACICRQANGCSGYPVDVGCLFIGEGARNINPGFGREVSIEEAKALQRRAEKAGMFNTVGKNRLDKLYLGVKPSEPMITLCHCCECCCLWQLLTVLPGSITGKVHKMDGVEVTVTENCEGCGSCLNSCFVQALTLQNSKAEIDQNRCRGCGRCVLECPREAIKLSFEQDAYFKKALEVISGLEKEVEPTTGGSQ